MPAEPSRAPPGAALPGPLASQSDWLTGYRPRLRIREQGSVVAVGDGIAWIAGLPTAAMEDALRFAEGSRGVVFDLTEGLIGAILLHDTGALTAGTRVERTGRSLSVPAGDSLLGRIVDPLGNPLDGEPPPAQTRPRPLERDAPPIVARDFVNEPLYTGIKIVDTRSARVSASWSSATRVSGAARSPSTRCSISAARASPASTS
jgi:F-type H+-transporting ATPase subunit alpha